MVKKPPRMGDHLFLLRCRQGTLFEARPSRVLFACRSVCQARCHSYPSARRRPLLEPLFCDVGSQHLFEARVVRHWSGICWRYCSLLLRILANPCRVDICLCDGTAGSVCRYFVGASSVPSSHCLCQPAVFVRGRHRRMGDACRGDL